MQRSYHDFVGRWTNNNGLFIAIQYHSSKKKYALNIACNNITSSAVKVSSTGSLLFNWNEFRFEFGKEELIYDEGNKQLMSPVNHMHWFKFMNYFTLSELSDFENFGYVILHGAIDPILIQTARRSILAYIGSNGMNQDDIPKYSAHTFVPSLLSNQDSKKILQDLLLSPTVVSAIQSILPNFHLNSFPSMPQVALRFPIAGNQVSSPIYGQHIDGVPTSLNGLSGTDLFPFNLLVGVALSDQGQPFSGNFVVYPGSHKKCSNVFKSQFEEQKARMVADIDIKLGPGQGAGWLLGNGLPPNVIDDIEPIQVSLQPGDVILSHYQLIHTVSDNFNDEIRMNCYWRFKSPEFHPVHSLINVFQNFKIN